MTYTLTVIDESHDKHKAIESLSEHEAWKLAFETLSQWNEDDSLARIVADGELFISNSGKSSQLITLPYNPTQFWQHLCGMIETDNQSVISGKLERSQ